MNDRFRFRAWDKEQKKMFYNAEMTYDYGLVLDACEADSFGTVLEDDNMIVMQCTGLKDNNGNLIYEGDIISKRDDYLFPVYWDKTQAGFRVFVVKDFPPKRILGTEPMNFKTEDYEIIGNIYENEELLNIQSSVFGTINLKSLF